MKDIQQFKDEIEYLKISEEDYYKGGTYYTLSWEDDYFQKFSFKFNIYSGIITVDSPNSRWSSAVYSEKQYGIVNTTSPSYSDPYVECNVSKVSEIDLFTNKKESRKEKCNKLIASLANGKKSKILGGYKDFYFGMSKKDAMAFVNCKKTLNNQIVTLNLTGSKILELYRYPTTLFFKNEKINKIEVQFYASSRKQTRYYTSSGIEEFEQIKKIVSDKYELLEEPTKTSIEKYNSKPYTKLEWVFKSKIKDNLILLVLSKTGTTSSSTYIYGGDTQYLSSEESKIYRKELDSKVVKSDDF